MYERDNIDVFNRLIAKADLIRYVDLQKVDQFNSDNRSMAIFGVSLRPGDGSIHQRMSIDIQFSLLRLA